MAKLAMEIRMRNSIFIIFENAIFSVLDVTTMKDITIYHDDYSKYNFTIQQMNIFKIKLKF